MIEASQDLKKVELKDKFVEHYKEICKAGDVDYDLFIKTSLTYLRRAIRVNTLKISTEDLKKRLADNWHLTAVPWCKDGFWIDHKGEGDEHRRDVGNLKEHLLGYIYLQEPASMLPPIVLDPKPEETILDMCAAPGSKATQISQMMDNQGLLIANDFKIDRLKSLTINMQRCGVSNAVLTLMEGHWFHKSGIQFDKIQLDAPCSGTGTIRKSFKTLRIWNPQMVRRLAGTQRQMLDVSFDILKPGGTMTYSTCSLEPWENEGVISQFLDRHDTAQIADIKVNIKRSKPILEFQGEKYNPEVKKCLRIWPQDNDTEGFFVCKILKKE